MLSDDVRVRPNATDVAAKVIDGEAIIMNLSNGLYFSMDQVGAAVWELAERGFSVAEMTAEVGERFVVEAETAERDVARLVAELLEENLVAIWDGAAPEGEAPPRGNGAQPYAPPVLNKYTDMADILALDPPMPGLGQDSWE